MRYTKLLCVNRLVSYISPTMNTEAAIKDNLPCETLATTSFPFIPLSYVEEKKNIKHSMEIVVCVCVCVCPYSNEEVQLSNEITYNLLVHV